MLYVDGSSNKKDSEARIILKGPDEVLIEQSLRSSFKASNNQAEYEALLVRIRLEKELGVARLTIKSDSQKQAGTLKKFILLHVLQEKNKREDLLAKLASTTAIQEALGQPTIQEPTVLSSDWKSSWHNPIINYLHTDRMPDELQDAKGIKMEATKYILVAGRLYKQGFSFPLLRVERALKEVHEGVYGSHIGGRVIASKIVRAGFYWPTLRKDTLAFIKKWDKCQRYVPPEQLHSMSSPWPFYMWGVDILGLFPLAPGQVKFLMVIVDYFTKWIEVEPIASISTERVKCFY
ncbi:Gypsy retrotransposon integrase-like protein 1, partial [Mucuna pruriens]